MTKKTLAKVLIIDDEAPIRDVLSASLRDEGYDIETASGGEEGLQKITSYQPQVVLLDIWMPGSMDGLDVLKASADLNFSGNIIIMSGHGNIETAVKATKLGAWDFVEKPLSIDKITILLSNLLAFQKEREQKFTILNKLRKSFSLIGQSPASIALKEQISKQSVNLKPILLSGEMGAGKQLVAQHIHYFSTRAYHSFVDVNCAAVSSELIEADLFGYVAGFFTGATQDKAGKIELANEGTLLLKEIESLSLDVQEKLLNFIKSESLSPLGGGKELHLNTRIIVSTTSALESLVEKGEFSKELYDVLSETHIVVPPLRDRKEDIRELVEHFSHTFEKEGAYRPKKFKEEAFQKFEEHSWPGNIRELKNFVERIFILVHSDTVGAEEIQFFGLNSSFDESDLMFNYNASFKEARSQFEKDYILKKLEENDGNISKTAELIGVERSHLHRKIKSYGIDV